MILDPQNNLVSKDALESKHNEACEKTITEHDLKQIKYQVIGGCQKQQEKHFQVQ